MPFQKGHKLSPKRRKPVEPPVPPPTDALEGGGSTTSYRGLHSVGVVVPSPGTTNSSNHSVKSIESAPNGVGDVLGGSPPDRIALGCTLQPCSKCTKRRTKAGLAPLYCYDCDLCSECFAVSVVVTNEDGKRKAPYTPQPHQIAAHACDAPNLLCLGTRGTGKSKWLRWDAIIRCMMIPNFRALIIRRTMPELRKSHLSMIEFEMKQLGGHFLKTTFQAVFPNGSTITFAHCETEADILNFLSSEYGFIGFDELSTFTLNQFLQISAAARAPEGEGYDAVVRCGSNPLGVGSLWMKAWFVDHQVRFEDYPDYLPDEFVMQFSTLDDNEYLDKKKYEARLKNLPDHVRRAWLKGEFVNEGTYFEDFFPSMLVGDSEDNEIELPWHVIDDVPRWKGLPIFDLNWLSIYRAVDWGYSPDPAVCLWIAVLPNKAAIVFKEMTWKKTLAENVAKEIKKASEGMHIVETFCDPTMFIETGQSLYSIADKFESNGVPLTAATNDREMFGYSINEFLTERVNWGTEETHVDRPKLQIVKAEGKTRYGCKELLRTLPFQQRDKLNPAKLADGEDHWTVALAYFCMGMAPASRPVSESEVKPWMRPRQRRRNLAA